MACHGGSRAWGMGIHIYGRYAWAWVSRVEFTLGIKLIHMHKCDMSKLAKNTNTRVAFRHGAMLRKPCIEWRCVG